MSKVVHIRAHTGFDQNDQVRTITVCGKGYHGETLVTVSYNDRHMATCKSCLRMAESVCKARPVAVPIREVVDVEL